MAIQADLTTENETDSDFVAIRCEKPDISFNQEVTEMDTLTGQAGAASEKIIGAKSGQITFNMPLETLPSDYDPTADNISDAGIVSPVWCLIANAMGSTTQSGVTGGTTSLKNTEFWKGDAMHIKGYSANILDAGSSTSTLVADGGNGVNYDAGMYSLHGTDGDDTDCQAGFIKTIATDALTLFEPSQNAAATNDSRFSSATAYVSDDAPRPLTIRYTGNDATLCYKLVGAICSSFSITMNSKEVPVASFTFDFIDYVADSVDGTLTVPTAYSRAFRIVGNKGGRLTFSAMGAGAKCGIEDLSIEYTAELQDISCHSSAEGISERLVKKRTTACSFTVPHNTTDTIYDEAGGSTTYGNHQYQHYFENQTELSLGVEVGTVAGTYLSFLMPAGKITEAPSLTDRDGFNAYNISMEANAYTGDTGAASDGKPTDVSAKFGIG